IRSGYHQLRVQEADLQKTAFRTRYKEYISSGMLLIAMVFMWTQAILKQQRIGKDPKTPSKIRSFMYALRQLKIHENNYTTHGLELGEVVFTLKIWKHVLVTSVVWKEVQVTILWAEIREIWSIGLELVQETTNKVILIKEKLKAARDCQKSYVGNKRKHLELKLVIK
ncbi:hypothetical protein Tco_1139458, partial [Tanacetum coccineum]